MKPARCDKPAGILPVADPIHAATFEALDWLHPLGFKLVMVHRGNGRTAAALTRPMDLSAMKARIKPAGKVAHVKK